MIEISIKISTKVVKIVVIMKKIQEFGKNNQNIIKILKILIEKPRKTDKICYKNR